MRGCAHSPASPQSLVSPRALPTPAALKAPVFLGMPYALPGEPYGHPPQSSSVPPSNSPFAPCLTRLWACVYIITPTTTSELLVLSLLEGQGFPIPPPAPPAAIPHSARGPLSCLSPLLSLPHLCFAPTIPKLLSVSHLPQLTRSLSHCHVPTKPVWLITPVPSGLPTCQHVPQTKVGPVAGPVALGVYP